MLNKADYSANHGSVCRQIVITEQMDHAEHDAKKIRPIEPL